MKPEADFVRGNIQRQTYFSHHEHPTVGRLGEGARIRNDGHIKAVHAYEILFLLCQATEYDGPDGVRREVLPEGICGRTVPDMTNMGFISLGLYITTYVYMRVTYKGVMSNTQSREEFCSARFLHWHDVATADIHVPGSRPNYRIYLQLPRVVSDGQVDVDLHANGRQLREPLYILDVQ